MSVVLFPQRLEGEGRSEGAPRPRGDERGVGSRGVSRYLAVPGGASLVGGSPAPAHRVCGGVLLV